MSVHLITGGDDRGRNRRRVLAPWELDVMRGLRPAPIYDGPPEGDPRHCDLCRTRADQEGEA